MKASQVFPIILSKFLVICLGNRWKGLFPCNIPKKITGNFFDEIMENTWEALIALSIPPNFNQSQSNVLTFNLKSTDSTFVDVFFIILYGRFPDTPRLHSGSQIWFRFHYHNEKMLGVFSKVFLQNNQTRDESVSEDLSFFSWALFEAPYLSKLRLFSFFCLWWLIMSSDLGSVSCIQISSKQQYVFRTFS